MAQSQILYGLGSPDFTSESGKFIPVEPMEFVITGESDIKESMKYVKGKKVPAGSLLDGENYKLKIGIEAVSWTALQFAHGQIAGATASIDLPESRMGVVPTSSPYEIVDADIGASAGIWVYQVEPDDRALIISTGAPATGTFQVDAPNNKLVFNAAQAGATVQYRVFKTYNNVPSIGVEAIPVANVLDRFSFSGDCYSDTGKYRIHIPKMQRISVPSLNLSDVTKLEVEYRLIPTGGQSLPYQLFKL